MKIKTFSSKINKKLRSTYKNGTELTIEIQIALRCFCKRTKEDLQKIKTEWKSKYQIKIKRHMLHYSWNKEKKNIFIVKNRENNFFMMKGLINGSV